MCVCVIFCSAIASVATGNATTGVSEKEKEEDKTIKLLDSKRGLCIVVLRCDCLIDKQQQQQQQQQQTTNNNNKQQAITFQSC
jgi:hypothetical protein